MSGIPHAMSLLTSVVATRICFFRVLPLYSNADVFRFYRDRKRSGVLLCVLVWMPRSLGDLFGEMHSADVSHSIGGRPVHS